MGEKRMGRFNYIKVNGVEVSIGGHKNYYFRANGKTKLKNNAEITNALSEGLFVERYDRYHKEWLPFSYEKMQFEPSGRLVAK